MQQPAPDARWMADPYGCLQDCELLLCRAGGHASFQALLLSLQPQQGGAQCSNVWTAGTIAYRCRTCQTNPTSSVCVQCFKAGGHEAHDWVQYRSGSGGCCDCGDLSSWAAEGCCPQHLPREVAEAPQLGPGLQEAVNTALCLTMARLTGAVEGSLVIAAAPSASESQQVAVALCRWLQALLRISPIRAAACAIASAPLAPEGSGGAGGLEPLAHPSARPALGALCGRLAPASAWAAVWAEYAPPCGKHDCLLRRLVFALSFMPTALNTEVVTLLLLLLYDTGCKFTTASHLLDLYRPMLRHISSSGGGSKSLMSALDRVMVQLVNSDAVVDRLMREQGLLEVMLGGVCLVTVAAVSRLSGRPQPASAFHDAWSMPLSAHRRAIGDLNTVTHHAQLACAVLARRELFEERLLVALGGMQGAVPHRRVAAGDMLPDSQAPLAAFQLEIYLLIGLTETISAAAPGQGAAPGAALEAAQAFLRAASAAAAAALSWPRRPGPSPDALQISRGAAASSACCAAGAGAPGLWARLLSADLPASLHLPLQRAAALALAAVLKLEQGAEAAELRGRLGAAAAAAAAGWDWEALCRPVLAARALVAQVEGQLWIRNGDDLTTDCHYYAHSRDLMADPDWLLLQGWLAASAAEGPREAGGALRAWLSAFGCGALLEAMDLAAGRAPPDGGTAPGPAAAALLSELGQPTARLGLEAALHCLVSALRDRTIAGQPPAARARTALLHWLALGDAGYQKLTERLPSDLSGPHSAAVDEQLERIAVHTAARLGQAGRYRLRPEAWRHVSAFFLHYTRPARTQAAARAASQAGHDPAWQLEPPEAGLLPALLWPLEGFAAAPDALLLVRYLLASALEDDPWGLPINAAAELASHPAEQPHRWQVPLWGGGTRVAAGAAPGPAPGPALALAALASAPREAAALAARESRRGDEPLVREDSLLCALHLLALALHSLREPLLRRQRNAGGAAPEAERARLSEALEHVSGPPAAQRSWEARYASSWSTAEAQAALGGAAAGAPRLPGIAASLEALLREPAAAGAWGEAGAPAPAAGRVGAEVAACCRAALALTHDVLALHRGGGGGAGETAGAAGATAPAAPPAAEAAAARDRRSAARAAQEALQRRLQAQQAAFMKQSVLGGTSDEDDDDEDDGDEDEEEDAGNDAMEVDIGEAGATSNRAAGTASKHHPGPRHELQVVSSRLQQLPGQCVLCHEGGGDEPAAGAGQDQGGGGGGGGPLGLLCHVTVCGTMCTALSHRRQWDAPVPGAPGAADPTALASGPTSPESGGAQRAPQGGGSPPGAPHGSPPAETGAQAAAGPAAAAAESRGSWGSGAMVSVMDWQPGLHLNTCGHTMHYSCFQSYWRNIESAWEVGDSFPGEGIVKLERREMPCPLCKRISNAMLPWVKRGDEAGVLDGAAAAAAAAADTPGQGPFGAVWRPGGGGPGEEGSAPGLWLPQGAAAQQQEERRGEAQPAAFVEGGGWGWGWGRGGGAGGAGAFEAHFGAGDSSGDEGDGDEGSGLLGGGARRVWETPALRSLAGVHWQALQRLGRQAADELEWHCLEVKRLVDLTESRARQSAAHAAAVTEEPGAAWAAATRAAAGRGGAGAGGLPGVPVRLPPRVLRELALQMQRAGGGGGPPVNLEATGARIVDGRVVLVVRGGPQDAILGDRQQQQQQQQEQQQQQQEEPHHHQVEQQQQQQQQPQQPWAAGQPRVDFEGGALAAGEGDEEMAVEEDEDEEEQERDAEEEQEALLQLMQQHAQQQQQERDALQPGGRTAGDLRSSGGGGGGDERDALGAYYLEGCGAMLARLSGSSFEQLAWGLLAHGVAHAEAMARPAAPPAGPPHPGGNGGGCSAAAAAGAAQAVAHQLKALQGVTALCTAFAGSLAGAAAEVGGGGGSGGAAAKQRALHLVLSWLEKGAAGGGRRPGDSGGSCCWRELLPAAATDPAAGAPRAPPPPPLRISHGQPGRVLLAALDAAAAGAGVERQEGRRGGQPADFGAERGEAPGEPSAPQRAEAFVASAALLGTWQQLAGSSRVGGGGDAWLLLLELLAAALEATALPQVPPRAAQAAAAAAGSRPATAAAGGGGACGSAVVRTASPEQLLLSLIRLVCPLAALQGALWCICRARADGSLPPRLSAACEALAALLPSDGGAGASSAAVLEAGRQVLVCVHELLHREEAAAAATCAGAPVLAAAAPPAAAAAAAVAGSAGAMAFAEGVAAQLLPLLMRAHLLHSLVAQRPPENRLISLYSQARRPGTALQQQAAAGSSGGSSSSSSGSGVPGSVSALEVAAALLGALGLPSIAGQLAGTARRGVGEVQDLLPWNWFIGEMQQQHQQMQHAQHQQHAQQQQQQEQVASVSASAPAAAPGSGGLPLATRPGLISLPALFQDLFLHYSSAQCPSCQASPKEPALCLATGRWLCSLGGCRARGPGLDPHAAALAGGAAPALLLRSSRVAVWRAQRLTIAGSPYLDSHGEEDAGLKRGRPLRLSEGLYAALSDLWAGAGFDYDYYMVTHARATDEGAAPWWL